MRAGSLCARFPPLGGCALSSPSSHLRSVNGEVPRQPAGGPRAPHAPGLFAARHFGSERPSMALPRPAAIRGWTARPCGSRPDPWGQPGRWAGREGCLPALSRGLSEGCAPDAASELGFSGGLGVDEDSPSRHHGPSRSVEPRCSENRPPRTSQWPLERALCAAVLCEVTGRGRSLAASSPSEDTFVLGCLRGGVSEGQGV